MGSIDGGIYECVVISTNMTTSVRKLSSFEDPLSDLECMCHDGCFQLVTNGVITSFWWQHWASSTTQVFVVLARVTQHHISEHWNRLFVLECDSRILHALLSIPSACTDSRCSSAPNVVQNALSFSSPSCVCSSASFWRWLAIWQSLSGDQKTTGVTSVEKTGFRLSETSRTVELSVRYSWVLVVCC